MRWISIGWIWSVCALGACETGTEACRETLASGLVFYRNLPLASKVDTAVIVVHGVTRDADYYFETMTGAAVRAGRIERTLIIAPHFISEDQKPRAGELVWGPSWKHGAVAANQPSLNAFDALDLLIRELQHVPRIVVTGHSAGGQLVNRYATVVERDGVEIIVANPSSYLYLDDWRPRPAAQPCSGFNHYPYGLTALLPHLDRRGSGAIQRRFLTTSLTLLLGERDTLSEYLDQSCEAMRQGANRLERGLLYARYLKQFSRSRALRVQVVAGVGHDNRQMYRSPEAMRLFFR